MTEQVKRDRQQAKRAERPPAHLPLVRLGAQVLDPGQDVRHRLGEGVPDGLRSAGRVLEHAARGVQLQTAESGSEAENARLPM